VKELRAALWGVSGFAVGYLLPGTLRLPTLAYDPIARAAWWTADITGVSLRYYGDLLWACASGLAAFGAAWFSRRPAAQAAESSPAGVLAGAALSLVALDVLYYLSRFLGSL
jgi:hypothetical protein